MRVSDLINAFVRLFVSSNGALFGSAFLGEPPTDISVGDDVRWDVLVESFTEAFRGQHLFGELRDAYPGIWRYKYESPVRESRIYSSSRWGTSIDTEKQKYKAGTLLGGKFLQAPDSPENQLKMTARYLLKVLNEDGDEED